MNAERRKTLSHILERIESLKEEVEAIQSDISDVASEEEESRENMAAQSGPNYEASEEASSYLEEADGYCDDILSAIDELSADLENIVG